MDRIQRYIRAYLYLYLNIHVDIDTDGIRMCDVLTMYNLKGIKMIA